MSDVTDYLLGELDPERVPEFEARLRTDAALRAEVDSLRPVVSRLSALPPEVWDPVAPPPLRLPETERAPASAPVTRRGRRLVLRGYSNVHWFPEGVEGWQDDHDTAVVRPDPAWAQAPEAAAER